MRRRVGKVKGLLLLAAGVFGLVGLNSCSPPGASGYAPVPIMPASTGADYGNIVTGGLRSGDAAVTRESIDKVLNNPTRERPGLATGWGESQRSALSYTGFERARSEPYGGVATIYYNDREGIEAMTGWKWSSDGMERAADNLVEWGVKSGSSTLRNYRSGSRRFVQGREGKSYSLVVRNLARCRVEAVLSVDGLDVMDGQPASTRKRGYVISPGGTLEVKGWRTSDSRVAGFEFSDVGGSYASLRHGDTRNVGVIGLAVFPEKGVDPWKWMPGEVDRRESARPFAEPPLHQAR